MVVVGVVPGGHTTPISISVRGSTARSPPVSTGAALMNLGKTIRLPGSWESDNLTSRVCADAGIAKASAGISSNPHLMTNFMVPSFLLRPQRANLYTQGPCQVDASRVFNELDEVRRDLVREVGTHRRTESDFSDLSPSRVPALGAHGTLGTDNLAF